MSALDSAEPWSRRRSSCPASPCDATAEPQLAARRRAPVRARASRPIPPRALRSSEGRLRFAAPPGIGLRQTALVGLCLAIAALAVRSLALASALPPPLLHRHRLSRRSPLGTASILDAGIGIGSLCFFGGKLGAAGGPARRKTDAVNRGIAPAPWCRSQSDQRRALDRHVRIETQAASGCADGTHVIRQNVGWLQCLTPTTRAASSPLCAKLAQCGRGSQTVRRRNPTAAAGVCMVDQQRPTHLLRIKAGRARAPREYVRCRELAARDFEHRRSDLGMRRCRVAARRL